MVGHKMMWYCTHSVMHHVIGSSQYTYPVALYRNFDLLSVKFEFKSRDDCHVGLLLLTTSISADILRR